MVLFTHSGWHYKYPTVVLQSTCKYEGSDFGNRLNQFGQMDLSQIRMQPIVHKMIRWYDDMMHKMIQDDDAAHCFFFAFSNGMFGIFSDRPILERSFDYHKHGGLRAALKLAKTLVDVDGSQAWLWTRLETIGFRLVWWFWMFGHIHICRGCCSPNFCTSAAACWSAFSEAAVWKMQRKGFSCNCPGRRVLLLPVFLGISNP